MSCRIFSREKFETRDAGSVISIEVSPFNCSNPARLVILESRRSSVSEVSRVSFSNSDGLVIWESRRPSVSEVSPVSLSNPDRLVTP